MTVLLNKPEINTYTTLVLIQSYHTVQHKYPVTRFIFDNSIFLGFDTADYFFCVCVCVAQQPNSGLGRLTVEVSGSETIRHTCTCTRTHTQTPGKTPPTESQHNTQRVKETNTHALTGIRTRDPSSQAAGLCLRPRGHWEQPAVK